MSAIFIYGAGATFALWHEVSARRAASREVVQKLDTEISYRFSKIFEILRDDEARARRARIYVAMHDPKWLDWCMTRLDPLAHQVFLVSAKDLFLGPGFEDELAREEAQLRDSLIQAVDPNALVSSPPGSFYESLHPEYKAYNLAALIADLRDRVSVQEQADLEASLRHLTQFRGRQGRVDVASELSMFAIRDRWRGHRFGPLDNDCPHDPLCIELDATGLADAAKIHESGKMRGDPTVFVGLRPTGIIRVLELDSLLKSADAEKTRKATVSK
jgi:hypothetical protein